MTAAAPLRFSKMHGAGNDFVIVDRRRSAAPPDARALPGKHDDASQGLDRSGAIERGPHVRAAPRPDRGLGESVPRSQSDPAPAAREESGGSDAEPTATAPLPPALIRRLADRHLGVGCDQLITIETSHQPGVLARYGIWNSDGSAAGQCGNGARCVAAWLRRDGVQQPAFRLESPSGIVEARIGQGEISIGMGIPDFSPATIPLRDGTVAADAYVLDFAQDRLYFGAVSMGNPHAVIEVADAAAADVPRVGPMLQLHPMFPQSCNVGFAQILSPERIRLRVFERGVGETLACGSGACAAVAVLARRGRVGTRVAVELRGGTLQIEWPGPGRPLWMSGPAEFVFEGEFIA